MEAVKVKIAAVCANGRVGKLVVKEAVGRGLDVTAIAKGENQTEAKQYVRKDLFDLTAQDLAAYDVVVDAFGAWAEELTLNERGESIISYADYAIAMVDEIVSGGHIRERISVVRK